MTIDPNTVDLNRKCDVVQFAFTTTAVVSGTLWEDGFGLSQLRIPVGNYFSVVDGGNIGSTAYFGFHNAILQEMNDNISGAEYFVTFISGVYRIENGGITPFSIRWFSSPESLGPSLVGMAPDVVHSSSVDPASGLYVITGSATPWYMWRSAFPGRQSWDLPYEPQGFYTDHVNDDGNTFSIGHVGTQVWADWQYDFEPRSKIRTIYANPQEPFTWERAVKYCRGLVPFIIHTSSIPTAVAPPYFDSNNLTWTNKEGIYRLRADASHFSPSLRDSAYMDQQKVDVRVIVVGTGSMDGLF